MIRLMSTTERQQRIIELAREQGSVRVIELRDLFGVSEVTIRHDLDDLAEQGELIRTHGGAITNSGTPLDIAFSQRTRQHREEKERIARVAAKMIEAGETILLDGGSTTLQVAKAISLMENTTFVTVGLNVAEVLASRNPHATVMLVAGELNRRTLAVEGLQVAKSLEGLSIDKLFLAIHAVDIEKGLTDLTLSQALTKKTLIQVSRRVILVADSSKFGDVAFVNVAPLTDIHVIVTDTRLPQNVKDQIEALGVKVFLA